MHNFIGVILMAKKPNLAAMSVDALFKLRDQVSKALAARTSELQQQLARLTGGSGKRRGRPPGRKGRKVPPKYRGRKGETWSGRGLRPRWLTAELNKGKKLESFAIQRA